jgi:hypothetical protein
MIFSIGKEGHWTFPHSGADVTDAFWGIDRPNNKSGNVDDCGVMVLMKDNFWWEDRGCLTEEVQNKTVAPICQNDRTAATTTTEPATTTTEPATTTTTEPATTTTEPATITTIESATTTTTEPATMTTPFSCSSVGGQEYSGYCYLHKKNWTSTWTDAEADCVSYGGHLVSIHSGAEESFLYSMLGTSASTTWLGASDKDQEVGRI